MKTIRTLLAASLISASTFAVGQSSSDKLMSVNIPFAFQAAGKALPAGHYTVSKVGPQGVLNLREATGRHGAMLITNDESAPTVAQQSKLVFRHTGSEYRLAEIVRSGGNDRFHVWQSKSRYAAAAGAGQIETLVADSQ